MILERCKRRALIPISIVAIAATIEETELFQWVIFQQQDGFLLSDGLT
jgi:hypothetical protein